MLEKPFTFYEYTFLNGFENQDTKWFTDDAL